jgi:hypothetical protein
MVIVADMDRTPSSRWATDEPSNFNIPAARVGSYRGIDSSLGLEHRAKVVSRTPSSEHNVGRAQHEGAANWVERDIERCTTGADPIKEGRIWA